MNIALLIIKRTGRSPRDQGNGGEGRRCRVGRICQGEMLCRSMKNCTGILPPQLTVWEADLISGESIRLELWEITLPKITLVTAVETLCSQGDLYIEIYAVYFLIYILKVCLNSSKKPYSYISLLWRCPSDISLHVVGRDSLLHCVYPHFCGCHDISSYWVYQIANPSKSNPR